MQVGLSEALHVDSFKETAGGTKRKERGPDAIAEIRDPRWLSMSVSSFGVGSSIITVSIYCSS